jgi:hypothetical protein
MADDTVGRDLTGSSNSRSVLHAPRQGVLQISPTPNGGGNYGFRRIPGYDPSMLRAGPKNQDDVRRRELILLAAK